MKENEKETTKKKVTKKEEKKVIEKALEIQEKKKEKKKEKVGFFKAICNFFKGVKSEMSKVVWPNRRNMVKYSIATIIFVLVFALYFYGIEIIMAWLKDYIVI